MLESHLSQTHKYYNRNNNLLARKKRTKQTIWVWHKKRRSKNQIYLPMGLDLFQIVINKTLVNECVNMMVWYDSPIIDIKWTNHFERMDFCVNASIKRNPNVNAKLLKSIKLIWLTPHQFSAFDLTFIYASHWKCCLTYRVAHGTTIFTNYIRLDQSVSNIHVSLTLELVYDSKSKTE